MPERTAELIRGVLMVDRKAFQYDPSRCVRTRRYHVGEAWPAVVPEDSTVTVILIGPGMRRRRFEDGTEVFAIDEDVWPKECAA